MAATGGGDLAVLVTTPEPEEAPGASLRDDVQPVGAVATQGCDGIAVLGYVHESLGWPQALYRMALRNKSDVTKVVEIRVQDGEQPNAGTGRKLLNVRLGPANTRVVELINSSAFPREIKVTGCSSHADPA